MSSRNTDRYSLAGVRGEIRARWTRDMDGVELSYPAIEVHNTLSYSAADVLAEAYGGDDSRIPKYIGFIYGPQLQASDGDAPASLPPITRDMDLQSIDNLCQSFGLNMQVVRFSRKPTVSNYSTFGMDPEREPQYRLVPIYGSNDEIIGYKRVPVDPDDSNDSNDYESPYVNNVVEFHAVTRSGRDGVYHGDTDESSPYAGPLDKNMYLYRAVLLGDGRNPCEGEPYTVLAMADLKKHNGYRQKPESYELALDWRVTFE